MKLKKGITFKKKNPGDLPTAEFENEDDAMDPWSVRIRGRNQRGNLWGWPEHPKIVDFQGLDVDQGWHAKHTVKHTSGVLNMPCF